MFETKFKFNFPKDWVKIEKERYPDYKIFSSDFAPCLFAFKVVNNNNTYVVTINDYGDAGAELISELKKNLSSIEEKNALIGNKESAFVIPKFYDYMDIAGQRAFVNLLKVRNDYNEFVYTLQIMLEIEKSTFCFAMPVFDVSEMNAINSVLNNPVVKDLMDVVIKSAFN